MISSILLKLVDFALDGIVVAGSIMCVSFVSLAIKIEFTVFFVLEEELKYWAQLKSICINISFKLIIH